MWTSEEHFDPLFSAPFLSFFLSFDPFASFVQTFAWHLHPLQHSLSTSVPVRLAFEFAWVRQHLCSEPAQAALAGADDVDGPWAMVAEQSPHYRVRDVERGSEVQ
jgi:hypothetical protein